MDGGTKMKCRRLKRNAKSAVAVCALLTTTVGYAYAADMPVKAPPPVPAVPFFFVNDTSVSFTWYPRATDPGVSGGSNIVPGGISGEPNAFNKYVGSVTHFDVWQYGTNFFNIDYLMSDSNDPIQGQPGARGNTEVYAFGRSTLGFNELSHSKMFSNFLTKDVSFEFGGDKNTQNTYFAPDVRKLDVGLQFALNLPGVVNVAILAQKEWNHNQFLACGGAIPPGFPVGGCTGAFNGDRDFQWAWRIESLISEPLTFLPPAIPLTWINVLGVTGPKGTGVPAGACAGFYFGGCTAANLANNETKVEVFEDTRLSLDASKVWWGKPGIWDMYVGYRYWYNKFGTDHNAPLFATIAPGTSIESTAYLGTTYHFK